MKIGIKKWIAILLAAAMLLAASACALEEKPADGDADADRAQVAAKVGGKYDITKGDVMDQYDSLMSMYEYYGMSAPTAEADIETMQDDVLDTLVNAKILLCKAEEQGIELSEEEAAAIETELETQMQGLMTEFSAQAEGEGAADVAKRAEEIFNEQLAAAGMNMDMAAYRAYASDILHENAITEKLAEKVKEQVTVTEDEIKEYYNNLLDTQKADYDETPANYRTDSEAYDMSGGNPVVYAPKGYMRVKTITVSPEKELDEAYTTLSGELDALEAEFGQLFLSDAAANAARIDEIKTEYASKKTEADELYEAYIKDARAKIEEAHAALEGGKSFDEVLAEFGEDDMYKTYPAFVQKGILMLKEGEEATQAKLVEAAQTLEAGAHSAIIQIDDMFYIVSPVGDEPEGTTPLEDVYDAIKDMALTEKAESVWNTQQEEWGNDVSLVQYFEDVYRDVGKAN